MREVAGLAKRVKFSETVEAGGDGPEDAETAVEVVRGDGGGETGDVESFCYERGGLGHDNEMREEMSKPVPVPWAVWHVARCRR
jgi:hypothetical protein